MCIFWVGLYCSYNCVKCRSLVDVKLILDTVFLLGLKTSIIIVTRTSKSHPLPRKCGGPQHPSLYPGNDVGIHAVAFPLCENLSVLTKETSPSSPSPSAPPPVRRRKTAWGTAHATLEAGQTVSVKADSVRLDRFQLTPDAGLPSQVWAHHRAP
jgi:hypothetical protein